MWQGETMEEDLCVIAVQQCMALYHVVIQG